MGTGRAAATIFEMPEAIRCPILTREQIYGAVGGTHTVTGRWIHQKMVSFKLYKFAPKGVLPTRPQYRTERGRSCREQQRDDHHYDNDYVESPLPNVCLLHPLSKRATNAPAAIRFLPDASLISSDR